LPGLCNTLANQMGLVCVSTQFNLYNKKLYLKRNYILFIWAVDMWRTGTIKHTVHLCIKANANID